MKEISLQTTGRNYGISLARVISMLMIVLCHVSNYVHLTWLAQFLNVGVFTFLIISGYLYSQKPISRPIAWIGSRWKKLCMPILIWLFITVVYGLIKEHQLPDWRDVLLLATNTQGVSWVMKFFPEVARDGTLGGLSHLWFVSVIMLCYLLMLGVKQHEEQIKMQWFLPVCIILFVSLGFFGINLAYFICFFTGYWLGRLRTLKTSSWRGLSIAMVIAVLARLVCKRYMDGTALYDHLVVSTTQIVIALWIFISIQVLEKRIGWIHAVSASRALQECGDLSYYIYITHYYFIVERFGLNHMVPGLALQMVLFSVLTIVSAAVLRIVSSSLARR